MQVLVLDQLVAVEPGFQDLVGGGLHRRRRDIGVLAAVLGHGVAHDMGDLLLGRAVGQREFVVVPVPPVVVAEYAAGMIDEAERLFDVALTVTGLGVILADQPPQRGADLLLRGGRRYSERFVERGAHGQRSMSLRNLGRKPEPYQVRDTASFGPADPTGRPRSLRTTSAAARPSIRDKKRAARRLPPGPAAATRAAGAAHSAGLALVVSFSRIRADLPDRSRR